MLIDENTYRPTKDLELPAINRSKLSPFCRDHTEEQKEEIRQANFARDKAEKHKASPFRLQYDRSKDFKLIQSEKSLKELQDRGYSKLSLNEAYRHVEKPRKFKFRARFGGRHNFNQMHCNVINQSNNKIYSDILGHLGSGAAGLSGSPPQQMRELDVMTTP